MSDNWKCRSPPPPAGGANSDHSDLLAEIERPLRGLGERREISEKRKGTKGMEKNTPRTKFLVTALRQFVNVDKALGRIALDDSVPVTLWCYSMYHLPTPTYQHQQQQPRRLIAEADLSLSLSHWLALFTAQSLIAYERIKWNDYNYSRSQFVLHQSYPSTWPTTRR